MSRHFPGITSRRVRKGKPSKKVYLMAVPMIQRTYKEENKISDVDRGSILVVMNENTVH